MLVHLPALHSGQTEVGLRINFAMTDNTDFELHAYPGPRLQKKPTWHIEPLFGYLQTLALMLTAAMSTVNLKPKL